MPFKPIPQNEKALHCVGSMLSEVELKMLDNLKQKTGETRSALIRKAIREYISPLAS